MSFLDDYFQLLGLCNPWITLPLIHSIVKNQQFYIYIDLRGWLDFNRSYALACKNRLHPL